MSGSEPTANGLFHIIKNSSKSYTWWLLDEERRVIAYAPRNYETRAACLEAIAEVKRHAADAQIADTAESGG